MLTRVDYKMLSRVLRDARGRSDYPRGIDDAAAAIADELARKDSAFDRGAFMFAARGEWQGNHQQRLRASAAPPIF